MAKCLMEVDLGEEKYFSSVVIEKMEVLALDFVVSSART